MADESFELPSQRLALNVIDHVPAIAGTQCDGALEIDVVELVSTFEVLDGLLKVDIRSAACTKVSRYQWRVFRAVLPHCPWIPLTNFCPYPVLPVGFTATTT